MAHLAALAQASVRSLCWPTPQSPTRAIFCSDCCPLSHSSPYHFLGSEARWFSFEAITACICVAHQSPVLSLRPHLRPDDRRRIRSGRRGGTRYWQRQARFLPRPAQAQPDTRRRPLDPVPLAGRHSSRWSASGASSTYLRLCWASRPGRYLSALVALGYRLECGEPLLLSAGAQASIRDEAGQQKLPFGFTP